MKARPAPESETQAGNQAPIERKPPLDEAALRRLLARAARSGRAPQTLVVDSAPPELKLKVAIPLPPALSITMQPLPPKPEQVQLARPREPAPNPKRIPEVNVISLPDPQQRAPDAVVLPKVNEAATASEDLTNAASGRTSSAANGAATSPAVTAGPAAAATPIPRADPGSSPGPNLASAKPAMATATPGPTATMPGSSTTGPASSTAGAGSSGAGAGTQVAKGAGTVQAPGEDRDVTRLDLPPNGKPRTSILGESAEIPGRIVATVYVKVGLPKNWILEYWMPGGSTAGLDAPWPYTILRPNLALPADADAILVRGHLSAEGKLEQLALQAPTEWTQKDSLFRALEQWKFRAAAQKGEAVAVDVLLVIPRQPE